MEIVILDEVTAFQSVESRQFSILISSSMIFKVFGLISERPGLSKAK